MPAPAAAGPSPHAVRPAISSVPPDVQSYIAALQAEVRDGHGGRALRWPFAYPNNDGPPFFFRSQCEAARALAHALELENAQLRKDLADSHSQIADLARRLVALEETLQPRRSPGPPGLGSGFSPIRRFRSGYGGDSPSRIFCANCAGAGHTSAECRAPCRYCGHPGHLSDQCPTRAPAPPM